MRWRESGGAAEEAGSLDLAAGGMTRARPVKVAQDGVVTIGTGTAIISTWLVGRGPDERVSGCERTDGAEVMGRAANVKETGAAVEEGTGGVTCTDDEQTGIPDRLTRVSWSVAWLELAWQ